MPITILMSGPPLWQLQFFFSLEHVIYYVVLSCIFFLQGTCNILLVHSQREYKVAIYVRSSLTFVCLFVCFFLFFFFFFFFFWLIPVKGSTQLQKKNWIKPVTVHEHYSCTLSYSPDRQI